MKLWNEIRKCLIENEKQKVCEGKTDNTYGGLLAFAESCAGLIVKYKCVAVMCDSELMAAKAILTCFAAGVTALPIPTVRQCLLRKDIVVRQARCNDHGSRRYA